MERTTTTKQIVKSLMCVEGIFFIFYFLSKSFCRIGFISFIENYVAIFIYTL